MRLKIRKKRKFPLGIGDTLLSEERLRMLDPREVMEVFGITSGIEVLDVGCGPGAFLEAASARVGSTGMVYAVDIQEPFINMAKKLAAEKSLRNIKFVVSSEDRIPLQDETVDAALLITTLHELDGNGTLKEVRRILRNGGVLGIVEWEKSKTPMGPPVSERIGQDESEALISGNGFDVEKVFAVGKYHYGISAVKAAGR